MSLIGTAQPSNPKAIVAWKEAHEELRLRKHPLWNKLTYIGPPDNFHSVCISFKKEISE